MQKIGTSVQYVLKAVTKIQKQSNAVLLKVWGAPVWEGAESR